METVNNKVAVLSPREIYLDNLQIIKEVSFTNREIDIIACILQGRTAKRIAFLLGIATKTVENHSRNIMLKIGCSSKEKIIDFVEKSGKFNHIKHYYSSLIIKLAFEKEWQQISSLTDKQPPVACTIVHHNLANEQSQLLQQLLDQLKAINVQTACITVQEAMNMVLPAARSNKYVVYCISKDLIEYIEKVASTSISCLLQMERSFLLQLDTSHNVEQVLQTCHKIDLTCTQNYYFAVFSLLEGWPSYWEH